MRKIKNYDDFIDISLNTCYICCLLEMKGFDDSVAPNCHYSNVFFFPLCIDLIPCHWFSMD